MTKLEITFALALAAVAAAMLWISHEHRARLREENQTLRQQIEQLVQDSQPEAARLATSTTVTSNLPPEQFRELLRLRSEVGRLRQQQAELEKLRAANRQLGAAPDQARTPKAGR